MKIVFISDSQTHVNIFPQLEQKLKAQIADLETETHFVPFIEDIPAKADAASDNADLIFVFVLYEQKDFKIEMLSSKLIDLEMANNVKIIKVIEESDERQMNELEREDSEKELTGKWSKFIINLLYHPEEFKPKPKEDSALSF